MPEVKFMAKDTALAMDEVERKLGADALILSMERRDGMIEIIATNDPDRVEEAMERSQKKNQSSFRLMGMEMTLPTMMWK